MPWERALETRGRNLETRGRNLETRGRSLEAREAGEPFAAQVVNVLAAAAASVVWDWSKVALVANVDGALPGIRTYALLIWNGRGFEGWMPAEAVEDLNCVLARWRAGLERLSRPGWTALFVGVVNDGGRLRSRWIAADDGDCGAWRIRLGESNVPMAERGLAGL